MAQVVSAKKEAQGAVDCVLDSITQALKKGDVVTLVGFGTFKVVKRKARKGRNPQNGEEIKIGALLERVRKLEGGEVLIATSSTVPGEATAAYLVSRLKRLPVKVT